MSARETIDRIVAECTQELFAAYEVAIHPKIEPDTVPQSDVMYVGLIGFTGDQMRGTLLLAPTLIALAGSFTTPTVELRDWVGELANQLLGRIKNRLLGYGVEITVSTPLVMRGRQLTPLRPHDELVPQHVFDAEPGELTVWLDLSLADDLELQEGTSATPVEGEAFMF